MRMVCCVLVLLTTICSAAYGQVAEQTAPFTITQFDNDRLLKQLAILKPFQSAKGEPGLGYVFVVTKEEFRKSLILLAEGKANAVMSDFGLALGFSYKDNTQFLILTQWRDAESAKRFVQVDLELWRLKDEEYKQYLKDVSYKEIEIEGGEKAQLTRKTIMQAGQKQDVTTFVSAKKTYFFECTLMGNHDDNEIKKLVLQIWKIVEGEAKKRTK